MRYLSFLRLVPDYLGSALLWALLILGFLLALAGCNAANTASSNISIAADNFEIQRRVVYYAVVPMKGVETLLSVEGRCSLGNFDSHGELTITCKEGPNLYKKHFFGLTPGTPVSYFVEQGTASPTDPFHHRIIYRPGSILPSVEFKGTQDTL